MRVLVTGAEGFVGRHMCRALLDEGHDLVTVDLKNGPAQDAMRIFQSDPFTGPRFDVVVHLAALVGGRKTIEGSPATLAARDLALDAAMFEWALRQPAQRRPRIVYFSSSAAYPTSLQMVGTYKLGEHDIDLDDPGTPDMSYGWTKLTGERLAEWARGELKTWVFRPFSGYGSDQDLDYPFPSYIRRGLLRMDPFDVWGDGRQVRDFVHITDVVQSVVAVMEADPDAEAGPWNIGTGRPTSFNELAELVVASVGGGYRPEIRHLPAEPVGPRFRCADASKLLRVYTPKVELECGIDMAMLEAAR